ncbi:MAG TPA: alpha/beta hydrolase [Blastocatellia bacterium]|nr:alpha/beta hydrolase [Blastocatellia bacterium]HMX27189.1 alpha/beta hydrolase [Blastocatellia bacterium]HMY76058.1 alpha/beta hydrolase [Blastocatellia bacterium]HMZ20670.1 alpha/beta hydrolase [Blastocatellia bacterium]HNG33893.1 alpha/beta hydrolase [Blastocatellia bacterium]
MALSAPFAPRHKTAATQQPSMAQDAALNNLRHPPGTETTPAGTLGNVRRVGEGKKTMLLIAGIGFGDGIWTEFMERRKIEYTMFAVTLPGFGGTKPSAMPADETKFGDTPWMRSSLQAINALLDKERIQKVTVVAHWMVATQLALQLALDQPTRVESVILIGGVLKMYYDSNPATQTWTIEQRRSFANAMGERWFKTVTRRTWDDNNFMSYDYAVNPRRGLFLWREAQAPTLPVWIRYLLEFYATDYTAGLKDLQVPVLVAQPGFDDPAFYVETGKNYMRNSCIDSWKGAAELSNRLEFVTIPKSRLFIQHDQPEALDRAIAAFWAKHQSR